MRISGISVNLVDGWMALGGPPSRLGEGAGSRAGGWNRFRGDCLHKLANARQLEQVCVCVGSLSRDHPLSFVACVCRMHHCRWFAALPSHVCMSHGSERCTRCGSMTIALQSHDGHTAIP
eukprot:79000-Chlamydomonas_euryale.AAC.2